MTSQQLKEGKAVFRCQACSYPNSYTVKTHGKKMLKKDDLLFKEFTSFPGIIGLFFFHIKTGVLKKHMPKVLKGTDLDILGKVLTNNYLTCQSFYKDVNEMTLVISNKNIVFKKIGKDLFVIIICKTLPLLNQLSEKLAHLATEDIIKLE